MIKTFLNFGVAWHNKPPTPKNAQLWQCMPIPMSLFSFACLMVAEEKGELSVSENWVSSRKVLLLPLILIVLNENIAVLVHNNFCLFLYSLHIYKCHSSWKFVVFKLFTLWGEERSINRLNILEIFLFKRTSYEYIVIQIIVYLNNNLSYNGYIHGLFFFKLLSLDGKIKQMPGEKVKSMLTKYSMWSLHFQCGVIVISRDSKRMA